MKTFSRTLFSTLILAAAITGCQKNNGGGGGGGTTEANLVVTTSPAADNHVEAPAPGPTFPVRVNITSAMPPSGVRIDVTARPDGGTVNFFSETRTNSNATNDFTINNATASVVSVATITVTSVSKPSNIWTGSYKFSRK